MPLTLRLVRETGRCVFCMRLLPRDEFREGETVRPLGLVCIDSESCVAEVDRQERVGWKDHPSFERTA